MLKTQEIAGHIRETRNVTFITGAGASLAAGIPLAGTLVKQITENPEYTHCLNGLTKDERQDYGRVMRCLNPPQREGLITPLLEKSRINWGQIALARLLQSKNISRVLTFNFDLVLERATALLGLHLPIYDFAVAPTADIDRLATSSIVHLHGQSHGLVLLNTEEETQSHKENLRELIRGTVNSQTTVVIGYSGQNDAAFDLFVEEYNNRHRLIWLGYSKEPGPHLKPLLEKEYFQYVGGWDFDQMMIELARELGVWPPQIFINPMEHLLEELKIVTDFPVQEETDLDFLTSTRGRLQTFSGRWEEDNDPTDKAQLAAISGGAEQDDIEGLDAGTDDLSEKAKEALAWDHITKGNKLNNAARQLEGQAAQDMFAQAAEKYVQALEIKPDKHEALHNWGYALAGTAQLLEGQEAQDMLALAVEKLTQALEIKPDEQVVKFDLACGYAQTGKSEKAMALLWELQENSDYLTFAKLQSDIDLDSLRHREDFKALKAAVADKAGV